MVDSRTLTALFGVSVSVAIYLTTGWLVGFLVVPFVPLLFRGGDRPTARECPVCGFQTTDGSYAYCPRDGTPLE